MGIKRLEIGGFKSIDNITLTDMPNYCVFAGANGSGKSNFFDALKFASTVIDDGATKAIRRFGGYDLIHCVKRRKEKARTFRFGCNVVVEKQNYDYSLEVHELDQKPMLVEQCPVEKSQRNNGRGDKWTVNWPEITKRIAEQVPPPQLELPIDKSQFGFTSGHNPNPAPKLGSWLRQYGVFRIDPFRAKEPDEVGADPHFLDAYGRNLSTVLEKMQSNKEDFEAVMEWMSLIVPGLEKIHAHRNALDGRASMVFQEKGTKYRFPPGLISDGTVYVLCLLAAVLTRIKQPGLTMIEEPERGIHPYAIEQLSAFFREHASDEHQIFISTHNESFVRNAKPEELFFVVKEDGRTQFRLGRDSADAVEGMPNDKAWLQNMFDGGLPW